MGKLKVLTLTVKKIPGDNYLYTVLDANGNILSTRMSCRSCLGTTFIAAYVTINYKGVHRYSIHKLATSFDNLQPKKQYKPQPHQRPYGIAVVEEHKAAFIAWAKDKKDKKDSLTK